MTTAPTDSESTMDFSQLFMDRLLTRLDSAHAELVEARKIAALSKDGSYEEIGEAIDCVEMAIASLRFD